MTLNSGLLLDINWQGQTIPLTHVPPVQVVQEILWEIYELNFWFEFKALDHRAHIPVGEVDGPSCDQLMLACFPGRTLLAVVPITSVHEVHQLALAVFGCLWESLIVFANDWVHFGV